MVNPKMKLMEYLLTKGALKRYLPQLRVRTARPRKPAPNGRAALVARQKKARSINYARLNLGVRDG